MLTREALAPVLSAAAETLSKIEQIDSQLGVEATGKTRVLNNAAEAATDKYGSVVSQLRDAVDETFGSDRIGVLVLVRNLLRQYNDEIDAFEACGDHVVDGIAARAPGPENGDPRFELTDVGHL